MGHHGDETQSRGLLKGKEKEGPRLTPDSDLNDSWMMPSFIVINQTARGQGRIRVQVCVC